jgi:hypothetical protein
VGVMALTTATIDWPGVYPQPTITPMAYVSRTGLLRNKMQGGVTRQRRLFNHNPAVYELNFQAHKIDLYPMLAWINEHGYDWFNISLVSDYSGTGSTMAEMTTVRFIGDLQVEALGHDYFSLSVQAELSPDVRSLVISIIRNNNWIIGNTPPSPSTDWVIGGSPHLPSTNWVVAGNPGRPSAVVK